MIGVLQGRLTPSSNGELQCFPFGRWREEFISAKKLGLQAIELLYEATSNPENPLESPDGLQHLNTVRRDTNIQIPSICADYFIQHPLQDVTYGQESKERLLKLIETAKEIGAERIILPFFEKSELKIEKNMECLKDALVPCLGKARACGIELALETTLNAETLIPFLDRINHPSIVLCYDLGNATALGHDLAFDIRSLGSRIRTVHVKDRKRNGGPNVLLGTGDTNFKQAFAALHAIRYVGPYILETHRGSDPMATAGKHLEFVRFWLADRSHEAVA